MSKPLLKARLKGTKRIVEVYKRTAGGYVDYSDCATVYEDCELVFPKDAKP